MELDREDRNWLEAKFGEVHTRITKSDTINARLLNEQSKDLTAKIELVGRELEVHKAAACPDVAAHEVKHHDPVKFWGLIAAIVTVGAAIGALLMWLIKQGSIRP